MGEQAARVGEVVEDGPPLARAEQGDRPSGQPAHLHRLRPRQPGPAQPR